MMEYLQVSEAQRVILESLGKASTERVPLAQSLGRVLAEDVCANRDLPPYDVSAMDGFALRSSDVVSVPVTLEIIEDVRAGDRPRNTIAAGQCARIMTGAPVPEGADAVLRMEDTQETSGGCVQINVAVEAGNDIRPLGENMRNGDVVLTAGTAITPGVIGILATVKCAEMAVYRKPRVAILSTGDELEALNEPVNPYKIPDANSHALMAQVQALGVEPVMLGIARDDPIELASYLKRGLEFDVLLVSGGTSVGVHDYVRPTIESLGVCMKFWRVAMKPGHPMAFGSTEMTAVFGLPGNPVSSMVCFEHFVAPALRQIMGHKRLFRRTVSARLTHRLKHKAGRTEFVRVTLAHDGRSYVATSTGSQGSGVLLSMAQAEGLLVIPAGSNGLAEGCEVAVMLLDGTAFQSECGFEE